jgi:hypothetical protein
MSAVHPPLGTARGTQRAVSVAQFVAHPVSSPARLPARCAIGASSDGRRPQKWGAATASATRRGRAARVRGRTTLGPALVAVAAGARAGLVHVQAQAVEIAVVVHRRVLPCGPAPRAREPDRRMGVPRA